MTNFTQTIFGREHSYLLRIIKKKSRTQPSGSFHIVNEHFSCLILVITEGKSSINFCFFHFKAEIAIFSGFQILWPYSLTKPDFFRFRVFFGACSLQNEVDDTPFFRLFGKSRSLPFCVASLKKSIRGWEHFRRERPLNWEPSGTTVVPPWGDQFTP